MSGHLLPALVHSVASLLTALNSVPYGKGRAPGSIGCVEVQPDSFWHPPSLATCSMLQADKYPHSAATRQCHVAQTHTHTGLNPHYLVHNYQQSLLFC